MSGRRARNLRISTSIDYGVATPCTGSITYTGVADGAHVSTGELDVYWTVSDTGSGIAYTDRAGHTPNRSRTISYVAWL